MADLVSESLNVLIETEAEAEAFVDSVMSSQRIITVDTPGNIKRKRNLSMPGEISSTNVKKHKASVSIVGSSEDELQPKDSNSDQEITKDQLVDSGDGDSSAGGQRRRLQAQKPSARKVIVTEADVHVDSDPSVKQLIAKLSADMHMLCSSLNERMDKLESCSEQKISTKVAQLLDKKVNTELSRIKKEVNDKLDSFKETFRDEINDELVDITSKVNELRNLPTAPVQLDKNRSLNVAIRDLPESVNENLNNKVNSLIREGLDIRDVSVSSTERKLSRVQSKPGVVIATFKSAEDKRKVMSEKSKLKNSRRYERVFIQHDQMREQRLLNGNFRAVIGALNREGSKFALRGTRVVRTEQADQGDRSQNNERISHENSNGTPRMRPPQGRSDDSRDNRGSNNRGSGRAGYNGADRRGRGRVRGGFRGGNRR